MNIRLSINPSPWQRINRRAIKKPEPAPDSIPVPAKTVYRCPDCDTLVEDPSLDNLCACFGVPTKK